MLYDGCKLPLGQDDYDAYDIKLRNGISTYLIGKGNN